MLYQNRHGQLIDEQQLNHMSVLEIEEAGIHSVDSWKYWEEEA